MSNGSLNGDYNKFVFEYVVKSVFYSEFPDKHVQIKLDSVADENPKDVAAVFENIDDFVLDRISTCDAVIGCSPYINNKSPIMQALELKGQYSIITSEGGDSANAIAKTACPAYLYRSFEEEYENEIEISDDADIACIEFIKKLENCATGRHQGLHSNFMVLGDVEEGNFRPQEIITGSFNFFCDSAANLENMISIKSVEVAMSHALIWYQYLLVALYQKNKSFIKQSKWLTQFQKYDEDYETCLYDEYSKGKYLDD